MDDERIEEELRHKDRALKAQADDLTKKLVAAQIENSNLRQANGMLVTTVRVLTGLMNQAPQP